MSDLQKAFAGEPAFRLVSFSIDPERDSVEELTRFRDRWAETPRTWYFARPTRPQLENFASGLKLVVGDIGDFAHTSRLVLVDKQGFVRGYYHGTEDEQLARLERDARSILRE